MFESLCSRIRLPYELGGGPNSGPAVLGLFSKLLRPHSVILTWNTDRLCIELPNTEV